MSTYEAWAGQVIEKIRRKMARVSEKNQDKIPYTTDEAGNYDDRSDSSKSWNIDDGLNWWTNGFWGGSWIVFSVMVEHTPFQLVEYDMQSWKI